LPVSASPSDLGMLEIVATFRPILTYKTRSDSDDGEG